MSKLKFKYDIKKDAWWWAKLARDKDLFGLDWKREVTPMPDNLIDQMNKADFNKAQELALKHLSKRDLQPRVEKMIEYEISALSAAWSEVEDKYFSALSKLFEAPIYRDSFTGYFTSLFICPYKADEHWFMISVWKSLPWQIGTVCHEIMHLQFHYQFEDYLLKERKISEKKFHEIKESVTILLNEKAFKEIILIEEQGYPDHQVTIKEVKKLAKEGRSLGEIVDILMEE